MRISLMKQSRKGESKERLVDILMYGWATSKDPDILLLARGYARRRNCQMYLAGVTVNWRSSDLLAGRRIWWTKSTPARAEGAEMPLFNDLI
jgi:hypothetical protein